MRIKIIINPTKEWVKKIAKEVRKILKENKHKIVAKKADATICIGGDGTILYAGYSGKLEGKILGIGSKRSYICQLHKKNWRKNILRALNEETEDVFILQYEIKKGKKTGLSGKAINDIVIHSNNYRVLSIKIEINGKKTNFLADGVIVSSGIGSTSYAYSAGGKKLRHTARKMEVVPIAPYRRKFQPIVVGQNSIIKICTERNSAFILDGIYIKELKPDETVIIKQDGILKFFKGVGWYEKR